MKESVYSLCPWYFVLDAYQCNVLQGWLADQWRRIRGEATELAKFDDVAAIRNVRYQLAVRRQFVPVASIMGSVGQSHNFTRDFLPRPTTDRDRWTSLYVAASKGIDLSPVELYILQRRRCIHLCL